MADFLPNTEVDPNYEFDAPQEYNPSVLAQSADAEDGADNWFGESKTLVTSRY